MVSPQRLYRIAPFALAAAGLWLLSAACQAPAMGERIVFSSNRDGLDGSRHLWMVAPDDPASITQLTTERVIDGGPSLSPDGTLVAFVRAPRSAPDALRIWVRSLRDGREAPVTTEAADADMVDGQPFWAPDGHAIGFTRTLGPGPLGPVVQTIWSVDLDRSPDGISAGPPIRIASDKGGERFHASWNPVTGSDLLFSRFVGGHAPYTIWRLDQPTGLEREVIPHGCCGNYDPAYSPDGRRFAYTSYGFSEHGGDVFVANADGTGATRVSCESGWASPAWSPDGTELLAQRLTAPHGLWRFAAPVAGGPCVAPVQVTSGAYQDTDPTWGVVRLR